MATSVTSQLNDTGTIAPGAAPSDSALCVIADITRGIAAASISTNTGVGSSQQVSKKINSNVMGDCKIRSSSCFEEFFVSSSDETAVSRESPHVPVTSFVHPSEVDSFDSENEVDSVFSDEESSQESSFSSERRNRLIPVAEEILLPSATNKDRDESVKDLEGSERKRLKTHDVLARAAERLLRVAASISDAAQEANKV